MNTTAYRQANSSRHRAGQAKPSWARSFARFAKASAAVGCLAVGLCAGWGWQAPAFAQDEAAVRAGILAATKELTAVRSELVARTEARLKEAADKGECRDVFLRFEEGMDEETAHLTARMRGGRWAESYFTVPNWHMETMPEKRNLYHRNGAGLILRDKFRFPANLAAVALGRDSLNGRMDTVIGLNRTREERMPSGMPLVFHTGEVYSWMDRWNPLIHEKPRCQTYELATRLHAEAFGFDLVFRSGAAGVPDFHLRFRMPDSPWVRPTPWTPRFNAGFHSADLSGLTFKDGVLSGAMKATLKPDPWFPKSPIELNCKVNGRLEDGYFTGVYEATVGGNAIRGTIEGRGGNLIEGFFTSRGDLGEYESLVSGFAAPARTRVAPLFESGMAAGDALPDLLRGFNAVYRQVRALSMADRQFPLPVEEALRQACVYEPVWNTNANGLASCHGTMLAHVARAVAQAREALEPGGGKAPAPGGTETGDPAFGPFYGSGALAPAPPAAFALPADAGAAGPQNWQHVPRWSIVGPLPLSDDLDANLAALPEIVPVGAETYELNARVLPKERQPKDGGKLLGGWSDLDAPRGELVIPWNEKTVRPSFRGAVIFARATIESPRDLDAWFSIAALAHAKLWLNGRLAWVGNEQAWGYRRTEESFVKLPLRKGPNELLVRLRDDRTESWLRLYVCTRGAPRAAVEAAEQAASAKAAEPPDAAGAFGDGYGQFPEADPPLAWDLAGGSNVVWKQPFEGSLSGGPVAAGGRLYVSVAPSTLLCLDQRDGRRLWEAEVNILELTDAEAFAKFIRASRDERLGMFADRKNPPKKGETEKRLDWSATGRPDSILADRDTVWMHHRSGALAAFDHAGKRKWMVQSGLPGAALLKAGATLVLDSKAAAAGKEGIHTIAAFEIADGKPLWRKEWPGYAYAGVIRVAGPDKARTGVLADGRVLDPATGDALIEDMNVEPPDRSVVYIENDMLFMTSQNQRRAVRFLVDGQGRLGWQRAWNSHYGVKESTRPIRGITAGRWFMASATVPEDRPGHSPVSRGEYCIFDRATGEPVGRIKPVFPGGRLDGPQGVTAAGRYVYVSDQNGTQMAVVCVPGSGLPCVLAVNPLEAGTRTPVFDGSSMFLCSPSNIVCVSAAAPGQRRYQQEALVEAIVERVRVARGGGIHRSVQERDADMIAGSRPVTADDGSMKERFTPLPARPDPATTPLASLGDEAGVINWLYAGPFPSGAGSANLDRLANLRVENREALTIGDAKLTFAPVPSANANIRGVGFSYHLLEGFGMAVVAEEREIDLANLIGADAGRSLVFYTVVANSRPRAVSVFAPDRGCTLWLGGKRVRSNSLVQLPAGYYPLVMLLDCDAFAAAPNAAEARSPAFRETTAAPATASTNQPPGRKGRVYETGPETGATPKVRVAFKAMDEPGAIKRARAARIAPYEPWLEQARSTLAGTPLAGTAEAILTDLAEARALCDRAATVRSARNDGSGRFDLARPPLPMTKALNHLWTAALPDGIRGAPVAADGRVFVGLAPGDLAAFDMADGVKKWSVAVPDAGDAQLSAPAVAHGRVCIAAANGSVLCCSTDGKVLWTAKIPGGDAKSPPFVLAIGEVFVVQGKALCGLDAAGGGTRWTADTAGVPKAPPVMARLTHVPVVFTANGMAVRATDGAVLSRNLPVTGDVAPQADETRLFCAAGSAVRAFALPDSVEAGAAFRPLWSAKLADKPVCQPVARNGNLFVLTSKRLVVLNAATGAEVKAEALPAAASKESEMILTAGRLTVLNLGGENVASVYRTEGVFEKVWEFSTPDPVRGSAFSGSAAVLAVGKNLLGIGGTALAPVAEQAAPAEIAPPAGFAPPADAPLAAFADDEVPLAWLVSAPFPADPPDADCLAGIGGAAHGFPNAATKVEYRGASYGFGPIPGGAFWRHPKYTAGLDSIKVIEAVRATNNVVSYLYTVLDVDSPRYARFQLLVWEARDWGDPNECRLDAWVSAKPIASGDVVHLEKGRHPLMVRATLGNAAKKNVFIAPRFEDLTGTFEQSRARSEKQRQAWDTYRQSRDQRFVLAP